MKKTLVTLLALAGVSFAGANETITLGSYYTSGGVKYDAVDNLYGKTDAQVENNMWTDSAGDKLAYGNADNLKKLNPLTLDTDAMLASSDTLVSGETKLTLTSFTLIGREDDPHQAKDSTLSITIDGTTYTTSAVTYTAMTDDSGAQIGYRKLTYTFTNGPTFTYGDALNFSFALTDEVYTEGDKKGQIIDLGKLPMGVFKGLSGTDIVWDQGWQGAFQLTASIPEPTTATLSLLALAGLAARRRRK